MTVFATAKRNHSDGDLREFFVGRRIVSSTYEVPGNVIFELDNGVSLRLVPNEGCSCGNGEFTVTDFSKFDHVITRISVADDKQDSQGDGTQAVLELFVYAEGISERVAEVKGTEGNGYYGRGFTVHVLREL